MEKDSSPKINKAAINQGFYQYSDNEDYMEMEQQIQEEKEIQPSINDANQVVLNDSRRNLQVQKRIQNTRTRICIDSIILQNFKSYEGVQKLGPFHKSFTSIVGPNGSGKSNLIQSLLFIFGFSASWMRQTKLGQLIHRSKNSNNNIRTSVQVVFHKIEQENDIVLQSFTVKRSVNTNNVSKYSINGYECHQKDVKLKLLSEGIDLNNNRFLILQGEVQQISSMQQKSADPNKPGLLQYLEQIIGSSKYREEINRLYCQYTSSEQRKHERGQIMKLIENQLRGMSQMKNEAVKYIDSENLIYKLENVLIQIGLNQESLELRKIDEKHSELQKERELIVEQEKQKLQKQKERIKQIKRNKQEIESITKFLNQEQESLNKLQLADAKTIEQILFKSEDLGKYQKRVQQLDEQVIKTVNEGEQLNSIVPLQQSKLSQVQAQYDQLKEELAKYNKPEIENQLRQLYRNKKTHEVEFNSFQNKLNTVKKQHDQMFEVMRVNDEKLKQLQEKIGENGKFLLTIDQATKKAINVSNDLFSTINHCHLEQDRLKTQIDQVESTIYAVKEQVEKKGGLDNMFNKIMQQNIPGVYGRLGDIGRVNEQYDEIVTSCLGTKLDNIVVQNYQAASAVIQFLKKGKIGRASCIILQTIKQFQAYMGHFTLLPESKRVFDMIEPKFQQASLAFYFVLRDTLYVKDSKLGLTYAMEDERNLRRVISQKKGGNGFIIYEINGIMNGCPKKRGGFETKANYSKIKKTEKDIKDLQQGKQRFMRKLKQIIGKKQEAKKQLDTVNNDIAHLKKQKATLETNIKNYKQQMLDLQKSNHVRTDWSYQENFEHKRKKFQKQLQALESKVKSLQAEIKEIAQLINEKEQQRKVMQSQNINQKREHFKKLKQENQNLSKTINHNLATMHNVKKKVEDFNKKKMEFSNRIKVLKSQIQKMKAQQKRIEQIAVQIYAKVTKHEARKNECENLDHEMRILLEEQNKQIAESKQKIQNSRINLEKCKKQKREKEDQIKQIEQQLNKIREMYKKNRQEYPEDYKDVEKMLIRGEKIKPEQEQNQLAKGYKKQNLLQMISQITPLDDFSSEKIDEFMIHQQSVISVLKIQRQQMSSVASVNVTVIKDYRDKYTQYIVKLRDLDSIHQKQEELRLTIEQLKRERLKIFLEGFEQINSKLRQVFQLLTQGGDASLDLIDSLDPFSDGIKFSVRPYKKAWKQINKLSGGQKTLSSLSLIFALHYYRPTPIYFMDEIDAALDYRNVSIVAQYIKKRTKNAQFIIISLRNNMFQISDKLIGIYKIDDKTRVLQYQVCGEEGSTKEMSDD